MNRTELQRLSAERIADAHALLAASQWSGAYYLAGYALECALKSCVLAHIDKTGIIFEDKKFGERCWTHEVEELVRLAGIAVERDVAAGANVNLRRHWDVAQDWSEASRYRLIAQADAEELYHALTDATDGILPWVKNYW